MTIHTDDISADQRVITPKTVSAKEEAIERALRPKQLDEYVGQEKFVISCKSLLKQPSCAMKRWIIRCCLDRQVWVKPPWHILLRVKWA